MVGQMLLLYESLAPRARAGSSPRLSGCNGVQLEMLRRNEVVAGRGFLYQLSLTRILKCATVKHVAGCALSRKGSWGFGRQSLVCYPNRNTSAPPRVSSATASTACKPASFR